MFMCNNHEQSNMPNNVYPDETRRSTMITFIVFYTYLLRFCQQQQHLIYISL